MLAFRQMSMPPQTFDDLALIARNEMGFWFWSECHALGPRGVSEPIDRSMLNWQGFVAESICWWTGSLPDGDLILAWAIFVHWSKAG